MIKKNFPNLKIDVAGEIELSFDGVPKKLLKEWVKKKYINYLGYIKDVRKIIKKSDVLILPSYHEGLPRSILEAMSVGRPVITTNIPGSKILVKNKVNGFKIPVGDAISLKNKMLWFINNQNQINKMGKKSRKIVKNKFDVEKINNQLLKLMKVKN